MNKLGLSKYAQEGEEFVEPEERATHTVITCLSDCMYAQNPEKTCMLNNVSFAMSKAGQFACGQYSPVQAQQEAQAKAPVKASPEQSKKPPVNKGT